MHHYCWALMDSQRGYDAEAIDNLNFVIRRITPPFPMFSSVVLQKATILSVNQNYAEALSSYRQVIDLVPDSEQAYLGMANLFSLQVDKKTAPEIAKQGLTHIPDSEKLREISNR